MAGPWKAIPSLHDTCLVSESFKLWGKAGMSLWIYRLPSMRRRVSSVVEHSSANPKGPGSTPGPVSYQGYGL